MKRRRALLFSIAVVLALCVACSGWLHVQKQQYVLNRALIDALDKGDFQKGDFQAALALVNAGADPNTRHEPTLAPTLPQLLKHLLHHTPPANNSTTALMLACYKNTIPGELQSETVPPVEAQLALIRAMLSHGANVNARHVNAIANERLTALNYALVSQNLRIVELLLERGADANMPNDKGITPLMVAASWGLPSMTRLLLAHGANPNAQDLNGDMAFYHASLSHRAAVVIRVLMAHGADPNCPTSKERRRYNTHNGQTIPTSCACSNSAEKNKPLASPSIPPVVLSSRKPSDKVGGKDSCKKHTLGQFGTDQGRIAP